MTTSRHQHVYNHANFCDQPLKRVTDVPTDKHSAPAADVTLRINSSNRNRAENVQSTVSHYKIKQV